MITMRFYTYEKQFIQVSIVMLLLLTVLGILYIWFLNRSVLRPFRKMQLFAKHIARGDLEVPLEMDRNHLFGAFTESFDMMWKSLQRLDTANIWRIKVKGTGC